ncbi:MAG TPA: FG-GAP repeat protein, partial [Bacillota bacterium]
MQRRCRSVHGRWLATLLAVAINLAAVFPMAPEAEAVSRSDGLSTAGAQIWRQGENGLEGEAEGHVIVPAVEASIRRRGDDFGAELAAGDFNGDGVDDLAIAAPGEDAVSKAYDVLTTPYDDLDPGRGAVTVIYGTKPGGLS